ncbi:Lpp/OprI family alanine-zipper lipoprotein [Candidatus Rariloculus sp.]|uniref:Lpp/OprI family alanine-zipper lipoprotein n=1 Tax=Candidatus Rariloculus sp. TaxID=3101265 RepID=UPI003D12B603
MTTKFRNALRVAAFVCGVALVGGCAHTELHDEVRAVAVAAQSAADAAQSSANEARQIATAAQTTANQALQAAQDAQACCDATNQRIDRMAEELVAK